MSGDWVKAIDTKRESRPDADGKGHGWVQWKGTDLCMDFLCPSCGSRSHIDGYFAYIIECGHCSQLFGLNPYIEVVPLTAKEAEGAPAPLRGD
jgi:hypothetical protein